jgi:hypothetical protein
MKQCLKLMVKNVKECWPWRLVASVMLKRKAMHQDQEALRVAIAAMKAATEATDAAAAAVNAAAAATAALNLSSSATKKASEPIYKWHEGYSWEGATPACPSRRNRRTRGIRGWLSVRK